MPSETLGEIEFVENDTCPLGGELACSRARHKVARALGAAPFTDREFTIWQCQDCGLGVTTPVPTKATAQYLYADRTSFDFQGQDSALVSSLKALAARWDVRRLCRGLNVAADGSILDFGCGNGAFVKAFQSVYPVASVVGADSHPTPPALLNRQNYFSYETLQRDSPRFDLVLCRHVLEHTYHPVEMVRHLRSLLRPEGVLLIEVPSLDTAMKAFFGKYWDGHYAPYHPIHFTRRSLHTVVELAGLKVIREGRAEMPKVGRSLQRVFRSQYSRWLFTLGMLLQPVQIAIGALTGTSVCLRIWAINVGAQPAGMPRSFGD